jgi:peptidyl-prolyl cis-trans isomerase D
VKVLIGAIILSFAIWGVGDVFTGGLFGKNIAEVGPIKIGTQQVGNEYQRELNRLRSMNVDPERARQLGLLDRVVQNMVSRASFDAEVFERRLTASDANIAEDIRSNPAFGGGLGTFDRIQFEQVLRANGMTEDMYVAELRQDIARDQALDSISTTIQVPKSVADALYGWREEKRVAGITNIRVDPSSKVAEPTQADLKEYHKENEAEFTAPERRAVQYLDLSAREFAKRITISEDELVAAFEERAQEFDILETRKVLQMVVTLEDQAKTAKERLDSGEAFTVVAKDIAGQTSASIDLGEISKGDLPAELSADVFQLASGEASKPLKGPFGWHIFKVKKINAGREAKLSDAQERLTQELSAEKAVDDVYRAASKLEDAIGSGASLEAAARNLGLELKSLPSIDASGRDAAGKKLQAIPGTPFVDNVFAAGINEPGMLTNTDQDGGFFIVRVSGITPAALQTVDAVKDRVVVALKRQKRIALAEARAKSLAQALEDGRELKNIPEAETQALVPTNPITRQDGAARSNLPFDVVNQLFGFKATGKVAVGRAGDRFMVAKLTEIQAARPNTDVEGYRGLAQNLRASITSDILYQYNQALRDSHGAVINNAALQQLFADDSSYTR